MNNNQHIQVSEKDEGDDGFDLRDILQVIGRNKIVIFGLTAIALLIAFFLTSLLKDYYIASAQIIVQKQGGEEEVRDVMAVQQFTGKDDAYYGTQIAIITGKKIKDALNELIGVARNEYELTVKRDRMASIIHLAVKHNDPEVAALITNKIIELYKTEKRDEDLFMARQMLGWLPGEDGKLVDPSDDEGSSDFLKKVAEDPIMQRLKELQLELSTQVEELSQRYKSQHPTMKELVKKLDYVEQQIIEQRARIIENIKANLKGEYQVTNIRVLQKAEVPQLPAGPNRKRYILLSGVLVFALSVYVSYILETYNRTIRSEEDVEGLVPFLGAMTKSKDLDPNRKENLDEFTKTPKDIIDLFQASETLTDEIGQIRTRILFSMPEERSKVILTTSTIPNEGKTTFSCLLAMSFAVLGEKTVLIDGDLRLPAVHQNLQMTNDKGVADVLIGQADVDSSLRDTKLPELKVLTGGGGSLNPTELLSSNKLDAIIDQLKGKFKRLIIDAPPSLHIPDAPVLSRHSDSRVLVCGAGMVDKKMVEKVVRSFKANTTPLVGVVINKSDIKKTAGHQKYYNAYKSYYGKNLT